MVSKTELCFNILDDRRLEHQTGIGSQAIFAASVGKTCLGDSKYKNEGRRAVHLMNDSAFGLRNGLALLPRED